jgi:NAD(P)-dependent dehydrogenase (short-subunit alcohol dehydrogenase family)
MESLQDRTAFVTGAGSGLGAAISRALLQAGARVALVDEAIDRARAVATEIDPTGQRTTVIGCDVTKPDATEAAVRHTVERFGSLDVLVNNAGSDLAGDLDSLSVDDWDTVIDTNLRGPFLLSKAALKHLRASDGGRGGHIVNIASTAGRRAWANASACHASKWGLTGLTQALYAELRGQGIRVSSVVVGGMRTSARSGKEDPAHLQDPANVAETVRFVLGMRRESIVAEVTVLPLQEPSWP